jgi:hypothetical protein
MSSRLHQKRTRTNRLQRWSICCCLQPEYRQRCNREQELEWGNDHSDHYRRQVQDQEWKGSCDRTQWQHLRQGCIQRGLHASQVGPGGEGQAHSNRPSTELFELTRRDDRGVCTSVVAPCQVTGDPAVDSLQWLQSVFSKFRFPTRDLYRKVAKPCFEL